MSIQLTNQLKAHLRLPLSARNDTELDEALSEVHTAMDIYVANMNQVGDNFIELLDFLINEDRLLKALRMYCCYLIATTKPGATEREFADKLPFELACLRCIFMMTYFSHVFLPNYTCIDSKLHDGSLSIQDALHLVVQCSSILDQYPRQNRGLCSHLCIKNSVRHRIIQHLYDKSGTKFVNYLKLAFTAIISDIVSKTNNDLLQLPRIYKEFLTIASTSTAYTDITRICVDQLGASVCDVIAVSQMEQTENKLSELFSYMDQLAPPQIASDVLSNRLLRSSGKAGIRRIAISYLANRIYDLCAEYEKVEALHNSSIDDDDNIDDIGCLRRSDIDKWAWGGTSYVTAFHTSISSHCKLLKQAYVTVWSAIFDTIMLDPAANVRYSAVDSAFVAMKSTVTLKLCLDLKAIICSQFFEVMLMKCSETSAKIRDKTLLLLISDDFSFEDFGILVEPESFYQAVRNLLRVSIELIAYCVIVLFLCSDDSKQHDAYCIVPNFLQISSI